MPISNMKMSKLAKEYLRLDKEAKLLTARKDAIKDQVLADLERRGIDSVTAFGVRITRAAGTTTTYNEQRLLSTIPEAKHELFLKQVVDVAMLSEAVQRGLISAKRVAKCTTIKENAAYIRVTEVAE